MTIDEELARHIGSFFDDPLGFVIAAYDWNNDKSIQLVELQEPWRSRYPNCKYGPDAWACEILDDIGRQVKENKFDGRKAVPAIRVSVSSGHGIGKSCLTAWLVCWIMSTRPGCHGTVTANTSAQLETRTWAQITTWAKRLINSHWFDISTGRGSMKMTSKENPSDWFVTAQTCREENSESFAGQHAAGSTSFYIFDEASAVPDVIWQVAEGGLTDGEPMIFVFGNPTRNSGAFFETFNKDRNRWSSRKVDSRTAQITNKHTIEEWIKAYGEDSDFVKVRVRGDFPSASSAQFISTDDVDAAMARKLQGAHPVGRVAVVGVDIAMFGDDQTVFVTRCGNEVFDIKRFKKRGTEIVSFIQEHVNWLYKTFGFSKVYLFMDGGGVGGAHVDLMHRQGWTDAVGINFGSAADDDQTYKNKRAEIWGRLRNWLHNEEAVLPNDDELRTDLISPEYFYTVKNQVQLESKEDMKKRGLHSPDVADALALTFAQVVYEKPDDPGVEHYNNSFATESRKRSVYIRR